MTTLEDCIALDEEIAEADGLLTPDELYALEASIQGQWDLYYESIGFNRG